MAEPSIQDVYDDMKPYKQENLHWIVGQIISARAKRLFSTLNEDEKLVVKFLINKTVDKEMGLN